MFHILTNLPISLNLLSRRLLLINFQQILPNQKLNLRIHILVQYRSLALKPLQLFLQTIQILHNFMLLPRPWKRQNMRYCIKQFFLIILIFILQNFPLQHRRILLLNLIILRLIRWLSLFGQIFLVNIMKHPEIYLLEVLHPVLKLQIMLQFPLRRRKWIVFLRINYLVHCVSGLQKTLLVVLLHLLLMQNCLDYIVTRYLYI